MRRWAIFNAVGILGCGLQLAVLWLLLYLRVHYVVATAVAVEAAVLHNFLWHERWTWRERRLSSSVQSRFWRFHAANGAVSLAGNVLTMGLLVGSGGLPPIPANLASTGICAVVNFVMSDRLVFVR
jgi:putative flippase GtrA